jgi:hypothetical protein
MATLLELDNYVFHKLVTIVIHGNNTGIICTSIARDGHMKHTMNH